MIAPEERAECTRAVQSAFQHLEERDATGLRADFEALHSIYIYSDYDFWKRWEKEKPQMVRLLFESLPFEEFLEVYQGKNCSKYEIWTGLDEIGAQISIPYLKTLAEKYSFPVKRRAPQIFERLTQTPDESIMPWLKSRIDALYTEERDSLRQGHSLLSWNLKEALAIISSRRDAVDICTHWLKESHFQDRFNQSEIELLDGLASQPTEAAQEALLEITKVRTALDPFRIRLLSKITWFAPEQALQMGLDDLRRAPNTQTREAILSWLHGVSAQLRETARQIEPNIDVSGWSIITRATLSDIWREHYPFWPRPSSFASNCVEATANQFRALRAKDMGCLTMFIAGLGWQIPWFWLVNWALGYPPEGMRWHPKLPVVAWTDLVLLLIVLPLFAIIPLWQGPYLNKDVRNNWEGALSFYGSILAFLAGTIVVRLPIFKA